MADTYTVRVAERKSDPAIGAVAISYGGGDQTITGFARGIYVDTAGSLKVDMADGTTVTFSNLAAGTIYPISITKIYQSGSSGVAGLILY